ncbi:unnamed protein product [Merluccius merluccius]
MGRPPDPALSLDPDPALHRSGSKLSTGLRGAVELQSLTGETNLPHNTPRVAQVKFTTQIHPGDTVGRRYAGSYTTTTYLHTDNTQQNISGWFVSAGVPQRDGETGGEREQAVNERLSDSNGTE